MELRFGFTDGKSRTLDQVGSELTPQVTRERARQLETRALRALHHSRDFRRIDREN